jgi:hypothetical protein
MAAQRAVGILQLPRRSVEGLAGVVANLRAYLDAQLSSSTGTPNDTCRL